FYVPAIAGGIFGLLGGYLIDLLGRRRILMWSILLYGVCTFGTAYVTSPGQFLLLRCGTFIGVSVEFVAATAWLAELFTHPQHREAIIGYTDRKSTRLNSSHVAISYAVFCLKKKTKADSHRA